MTDKAVVVPCVTFQFNFNLDGTRENFNSVTAQFNVPLDEPVGNIHGYTDKVVAVVERQRARYRLVALQTELHTTEQWVVNMKEDLQRLRERDQKAHLASGKRAPYKPSAQQARDAQQAEENIRAAAVRVDRIKAEIKATGDQLGPNVRANN